MELNLSEPGQSRYLRVYEYYKELIVSGQMKPGAKLPSIRKCSLQLQLSRTTVETAYMLLAADGYIISRPQSGFYVTDAVLAAANREEIEHGVPRQEERPEIRYDFASSNVDRESFQFDLWRRYVKSALRQDERLLSYGEPQGEREFREALCAYLGRHRNVICTPDSIVVGAGVQSLLHILCPMLRERDSAWFFNPSFRQGRQIFEDYGFRTGDIREYWENNDRRIESSKKGLFGIEKPDVCATEMKTGLSEQMSEAMRHTGKSVCYLTPSQMTVWGEVMPVGDRMKLLKDAAREDMLIIEDDYNSEFRYYNRPTPSLQGLSGGRGVVYLGTFSRLLLPSIRMSYMVLPPDLLKRYQERGVFITRRRPRQSRLPSASLSGTDIWKARSESPRNCTRQRQSVCVMRCGAFLEKKRERIWAMPVFWFSWSLTARLHRRKLPGVRHRQASPSARWSRSVVFWKNRSIIFKRDIRSSCCPVLRWGQSGMRRRWRC